jgi:hypothetical protein
MSYPSDKMKQLCKSTVTNGTAEHAMCKEDNDKIALSAIFN